MTAQALAGKRVLGKRVLVTRAAHQAGMLSERLRAIGAEAVEVAVIEIRPPLDFAPLDCALRALSAHTTGSSSPAPTPSARFLIALPRSLGLSLADSRASKSPRWEIPRQPPRGTRDWPSH